MDKSGKPTTEVELTLWQRVTRSAHDLDKAGTIDPSVVAQDAFDKLKPELRDAAALMALRQIARDVLRNLHPNGNGEKSAKPAHRASDEAPTFPGDDFTLLQVRYPKAHVKGKPQGYALRDEMTEEDWNWNIDQLEHDGRAKGAHASQLKRWGERIKNFIRCERSHTLDESPASG